MAAAAVLPLELDHHVTEFISRPRKMLIGGKWVESASGKTFPTYDPATGKVLAVIAEGDREDVNRAVAAARRDSALVVPAYRTLGSPGLTTIEPMPLSPSSALPSGPVQVFPPSVDL